MSQIKAAATANTQLALLGGDPVRTEPYPPHTTDIGARESELVQEVLDAGVLTGFAAKFDHRWDGGGGKMVKGLEAQLCERWGVKHAVAFNSATSALHGATAAVGIEPGDEVIVPPLTMTATATCVLMQGGIPVFSDVDDVIFQLDPDKLEEKITDQTKAVIAVNLCGMAANLDEIKAITDRHGLRLIEDNAHAYDTKYKGRWTGTVGDIGIVSLNYHKLIQCGEGGVAVTNDDELALRLKLLRNHGEDYVDAMGRADLPMRMGWNYRMTELQAAVSIAQFEKLNDLTDWRVPLGRYLTEKLADHPFLTPPHVPEDREMNYYIYTLKFDAEAAGISRHTFVEALKAEGIWANPGYVNPIYRQPMYAKKAFFGPKGFPFMPGITERKAEDLYFDGCCPVAERLHDEELITVLWIRYPLTRDDVDEMLTAIDKITHSLVDLRAWEGDR